MAHIKHSATRAEATPMEWLKVGSQIGRLTNTLAGRDNIVAYVGPNAGDAPSRSARASCQNRLVT